MSVNFDTSQFDSYREDNRREVKKAKGGLPLSLWESYSAFANCYGGVIILGVKENKDGSWYMTGLDNAAKLRKDLWDTINNKNKVSINLLTDDDVEIFEENSGVIMVIHVPKAKREQKPVYINGDMFSGTFRRNWEGDYHCDRSEVLAMLRDQPEETADMKILQDMPLDVLNSETVHAYRNRHMAYRREHVWERLSDEEYLERIGAARMSAGDHVLRPTAAGLLMFGEEYKILYEFPEYFLDYREVLDPTIRWTDRLQSSSGDWTGNLFDFFFRVYGKIVKDLKIPFKLEGITRIALMKMFNLIGIGERAGSGVPDIFSVWNDEEWREPEVDEQYNPDRTILKLPLVRRAKKTSEKNKRKKQAKKTGEIKQTKKTIENKEKIIAYLLQNNIGKTGEIAEWLDLSEARTRALLKEMADEGSIESRGKTKKKEYYLLKKDI